MISMLRIALRECGILTKNPIYFFCMIVFPLLVMFFFTSMMNEGQPLEMPVGIVDNDNSAMTRSIVRRLDAFQTSRVVGHFPNVAEARNAIQRGEIYAFLYIPEGTTDALLSSRQPKISFYYTNTMLAAGALLFRDLKTVSTLASAAVGQATLSAKGFSAEQIRFFLQPTTIDLHPIGNPLINYNVYLSTLFIPGCLMLFIFLITAYSIGTELKFNRAKEWLAMAQGNIHVAVLGKLLPQFLVFFSMMLLFMWYVFGHLRFPHPGGLAPIIVLAVLSVMAAQAFGVFAFGLMPSLRMSMSVCSLWAVLSFSVAGSAFPVAAMDGPIEALSWLFPLRHYFMIYQTCILNGYPLSEAWPHLLALTAFIVLPLFVLRNIRRAMLEFVYIP